MTSPDLEAERLRIIFMGSDEFSLSILQGIRAGTSHGGRHLDVVAVVTQPDRPAGRGRSLASSPPKIFAQGEGIAVLQPERVRRPAVLQEVAGLRPDVILVASYGQILPQALLDAPTSGCLNLHPSLLPRYRGPSPISAPILMGDAVTGTTLMLMTAGMDEGPLLAQTEEPIRPEDTAGELRDRLAVLSVRLFLDTIDGWIDGRVRPRSQNGSRATYTRMFAKSDARIDWRKPAATIAREIRAYNPWPVAFSSWGDRRIRFLRATDIAGDGAPGKVLGLRDGRLIIGTGRGLVAVSELQLAGGRPLAAAVALRGHPTLAGAGLE